MDTSSRAVVGKALGLDETHRSIQRVADCLEAVGVTQVDEAVYRKEDGEYVLDVTSSHTVYRILLSRRGSVEAIKNLDSGEWLMQSFR